MCLLSTTNDIFKVLIYEHLRRLLYFKNKADLKDITFGGEYIYVLNVIKNLVEDQIYYLSERQETLVN